MRKLLNDRRRLQHIIDLSARAVQEYEALNGEVLPNDDLRYFGLIRLIQTVGEACRKISRELQDVSPQVAWSEIIGFRNVLVHDYDEIDEEIIWRVLADELPMLHQQITDILATLPTATDE